jgi:ATP-dependent helicase/nuclease subunit A
MNPPPLTHQAIAASAGTGKTYALAHRYIALAQRGVPPERICALTFSRKAAGEIFDEIIRHLCDSAGDAGKARESSREIGIPLSPAAFAATLRRVVDHLHRLHIGTIDSFVAGVVRAFPFELGISPDFRIGDSAGAAGDDIRRTLFGRLFDPAVTSEPVRQAFLESFKLATFGLEHKAMGPALEEFITDLGGIHRRIPSPQSWGQPLSIWGRALPWPRLAAEQRASLAAAASEISWPDAAAAQHAEMIAFLRDYDGPREWPVKLESRTLFPRLWQVLATPAGETFSVPFNRKNLPLPAPAADALRLLIKHAMAVELDRTLQQTRGVESLLALYESLYSEHMRRSGQLSFDDLARLISGGSGLSPSRTPDKPDHLFINYRLDAVLDHWLLDEFQDTNDLQWQVLGNLIDETVQDDSGTRSFFYVGDVKQAIYGWRGGNHRLFGQVKSHYGEAIAEIHRDVSFRSSPVVIDALNAIFGTLSTDDHLPPKTLADWRAVWREHTAARPDLPGSVELLEAAPGDDEREDDARYRTIAARLAEIDPVARGLQAAVLLRTNDQARRCADILRAHLPGMPVTLEGKASLLDNPLVPLLLSLVRIAAHPGDRLAWRHLQMSPLGDLLQKSEIRSQKSEAAAADIPEPGTRNQDPASARETSATLRDLRGEAPLPPSTVHHPSASARSTLSLALLTQIHRDGFQATLRDWCARLEAAQPLDAFTRLRRDDLLDAAAACDATGDRDCDRFARFIEGYTRNDTAADTSIRVMTIHQSKGLGFDLVCVPFDPASESFDNPGRADMLEEAGGRWVLKSPRQLIVDSDPVLAATAANQLADAAFAKLCVFYVSLTRAKQGLILVVSPPPKTGTVVREDTLLRARFAATPDTQHATRYSSGTPDWHKSHTRRPPSVEATAWSQPPVTLSLGAARLNRVEPSKQDAGVRPAASCFKRESGDVRVFGSAIHRLFQQIEWIETFDLEQAVQAWRATATEPAAVLRDVEQQFRTSLAAPDVRRALSREHARQAELETTGETKHTANAATAPDADSGIKPNLVLWREKAFELLLDGALLAGQFDRVVLSRDASGVVQQATLLDFKSNRVENEAALQFTADKYREQMALYTVALRRILGPVPVTAQLVFTRVGRVVKL